MKKVLLTTSALCVLGGFASAGGIERGSVPLSVMFEDGNYLQLGVTNARPAISGSHGSTVSALGIPTDTENLANPETLISAGLKMQLNEQLSFGFFLTNPYGASAEYTQGLYSTLSSTQLAGLGIAGVTGNTNLRADWRSTGYEAILKYQLNEHASVYGGLRAVTSSADIAIPIQLVTASAAAAGNTFAFDYYAQGEKRTDLGYVLGAAYEIPDIAARVAITYRSEIEHSFDVKETASRNLGGTLSTALGGFSETESTLKVRMPQSLTIDFQTGIAEDTLLFGSAKWVEWSVWEVRTEQYENQTNGNIVSFENDTWTYSLGIGRRINDNLSVFGSLGYEEARGGEGNRLAPTDGTRSLSVGGSYTFDDGTTIRAGVQHALVGGTEVSDGALGTTEFEDNTVTTFGMSVGFSF
ncbi:MAG: outer membrane protein transport protein [Marinovum sp.]|nr:outer membrane protein transport protein [Marinovum sp.]